MLFNSQIFVVFFAVVFLIYWRLPHRGQNWFLMAASLFFYGVWNSKILLVLVASASIDYVCGIAIEEARSERARRTILLVSLACTLAVLCFFKYANFFLDNMVELLRLLGVEASRPALHIILPVGISFHTFQAMSYAVDVFRRKQRACRHYPDYLLYISFFPQLVAGPIERGARLLPQVERERSRLNLGRKLEGIKLLIVGYLQKVAIAD
jgi:alginate O-acetyltransferase complex protein AlgI